MFETSFGFFFLAWSCSIMQYAYVDCGVTFAHLRWGHLEGGDGAILSVRWRDPEGADGAILRVRIAVRIFFPL